MLLWRYHIDLLYFYILCWVGRWSENRQFIISTASTFQLHQLNSWKWYYWYSVCIAPSWIWIGAVTFDYSRSNYGLLLDSNGTFLIPTNKQTHTDIDIDIKTQTYWLCCLVVGRMAKEHIITFIKLLMYICGDILCHVFQFLLWFKIEKH